MPTSDDFKMELHRMMYGAMQEGKETADAPRLSGWTKTATRALNPMPPDEKYCKASACWGYVKAVVDSVPDNEDSPPDANVRINQHVDVVVAYLWEDALPTSWREPRYRKSSRRLQLGRIGETARNGRTLKQSHLDGRIGWADNRCMPKPLISPLGKRQPRALVIGLRTIVKDPKATVTQRLEACKLLAIIEGYIGPSSRDRTAFSADTLSIPASSAFSETKKTANASRLRELLEKSADSA